jgi:hypothetical protein
MRRAVPLLPIRLHGVVLKDRNNCLGVRQEEIGNDPAGDHTFYYGCGKVHRRIGSEMMFCTAYMFFYINRRN